MIALGIDPGTTRIGYGIVKNEKGRLTCIAYGILSNPGKDKLSDYQETEKDLAKLIKKYLAHVIVVILPCEYEAVFGVDI